MIALDSLNTALSAAHNLDHAKLDDVFLLWSDGEITMEKGGGLFGQRSRHQFHAPIFTHEGPVGRSIRGAFPTMADRDASIMKDMIEFRKLVDARDTAHRSWEGAITAGTITRADRNNSYSKTYDDAQKKVDSLRAWIEKQEVAPLYIICANEGIAISLRTLMLEAVTNHVNAIAALRKTA